jgi:hypothetical protein
LAVDNILERLLKLPVKDKAECLKVTRIGHPARVMSHEGVLESTLKVKSYRSGKCYYIPFESVNPMIMALWIQLKAALVEDVKQ